MLAQVAKLTVVTSMRGQLGPIFNRVSLPSALKIQRISCCHSDASPTQTPQTFASLVRNCKFTSMGDPVGKTVVGKIYHVVGDDLYIDFGHKFGCVCTRPR